MRSSQQLAAVYLLHTTSVTSSFMEGDAVSAGNTGFTCISHAGSTCRGLSSAYRV
jgi:hypothetical protein